MADLIQPPSWAFRRGPELFDRSDAAKLVVHLPCSRDIGRANEDGGSGPGALAEVVRSRDRFDRFVDRGPAWAELRRQGFRFVLVGGIVAGVYVGTTIFLAEVAGLPFEAALAVGFAVAIVTHFSLQRLYVWRNAAAFALSLHHQVARYLAMAAVQYGLTAAITATLPQALGVSPEVVYLPTVLVISATNFLVFRSRIFHAAIDPLHQ